MDVAMQRCMAPQKTVMTSLADRLVAMATRNADGLELSYLWRRGGRRRRVLTVSGRQVASPFLLALSRENKWRRGEKKWKAAPSASGQWRRPFSSFLAGANAVLRVHFLRCNNWPHVAAATAGAMAAAHTAQSAGANRKKCRQVGSSCRESWTIAADGQQQQKTTGPQSTLFTLGHRTNHSANGRNFSSFSFSIGTLPHFAFRCQSPRRQLKTKETKRLGHRRSRRCHSIDFNQLICNLWRPNDECR